MNAGELLSQLTKDLSESERDVQVILAHVMERPRTWLLAHLDTHLSQPQIDSATQAFNSYQAGTPLPYIIGHWEFFGLDLEVTKDVLIPRPETELLVEKAIIYLQNNPNKKNVIDIGTGSGAIAISIAVNVPDTKIWATEISTAALEVAKRNANKLKVDKQIEFIECDLLPENNLASKVDLICANLPYVPTEIMLGLSIYGREPTLALDGGSDGLALYRRLFKLIPDWLAPQGKMLFEIEASLGQQSLSLAHKSFPHADIHLHQDLTGRDRLLEINVQ
jgi:release factor glutamine methyltransferase